MENITVTTKEMTAEELLKAMRAAGSKREMALLCFIQGFSGGYATAKAEAEEKKEGA